MPSKNANLHTRSEIKASPTKLERINQTSRATHMLKLSLAPRRGLACTPPGLG